MPLRILLPDQTRREAESHHQNPVAPALADFSWESFSVPEMPDWEPHPAQTTYLLWCLLPDGTLCLCLTCIGAPAGKVSL